MRLFFFLAPILHVGAKILLLDGHKSVTSAPTFDFFEHRPNAYNVTGIACRMPLVEEPKTQLCKVAAPPALEGNNFTQAFQQTIMYVDFRDARKCGISTISQLFGKVYEMQPFLSRAGYPPSRTLVIFTGALYNGVVGCPLKEPYIARRISVPDSSPPSDIDVALVGGKHAGQFLDAFDHTQPHVFSVVQETDPWNALFMSFSYVFFNWCSIIIYIICVLTALKTTFETHGKGALTRDLRNAIFWMAILSSLRIFNPNKFLVAIISRPMRHHTYLRENLAIISGFFCATASQTVLYLWTVLLMNIQPSRSIFVLRGIILFGVLSSIAACASTFFSFNLIYDGPKMDVINGILSYIAIPVKIILAVTFVGFSKLLLLLLTIVGVNFHLRKKTLNALPQAVSALTRLSLLGLIGFLGYGVIIVASVLYIRENVCDPVAMLTIIIVSESALLLCGVALLVVFRGNLRDAKS